MAKKATKSFVVVVDGKQYTVRASTVFADAHPIVTGNSTMFTSVTDTTASALATPANVTAGDPGATTCTVTWDAVANATSYTVTTDPATTTYHVTDETVDLTGLTTATEYDVNVVAGGSPYSADSAAGTDTFTTD